MIELCIGCAKTSFEQYKIARGLSYWSPRRNEKYENDALITWRMRNDDFKSFSIKFLKCKFVNLSLNFLPFWKILLSIQHSWDRVYNGLLECHLREEARAFVYPAGVHSMQSSKSHYGFLLADSLDDLPKSITSQRKLLVQEYKSKGARYQQSYDDLPPVNKIACSLV